MLKSGLLVLGFVLLGLVAACGNSPVAQKNGGGTIEDSAALDKVALVVPTIF